MRFGYSSLAGQGKGTKFLEIDGMRVIIRSNVSNEGAVDNDEFPRVKS